MQHNHNVSFRRLLSLLLLLYLNMSLPVRAAAVSGADLFVVDCTNQTFTLRFRTNKAPQAVKTNNIRKESSPAVAVAWSVFWQAPQPSLPAIKEYQALGAISGTCPVVGRYIVPITVIFDENTQESLEIYVVRPAEPTLDLPPSITLRTELWPSSGLPYVPSIWLRETSGAGPVEGISTSGGQLKNAGGELVDTMLNPDLSPNIEAGQGVALKLRLSNEVPVGTYTTRLLLHSPALKQAQPIDVTLKVIVLPLYLFLTIAVGVVAGWYVNVRFAAKSALDTTRIDAYRVASALGRRAVSHKDPAVQQRFIALVAALESEIRDARNSQEVQASLTKSANDGDAIDQEALKAADTLRLALAGAEETLAPDHLMLDKMMRQMLDSLTKELGAIDNAAAAGDVTDAQRRLDEFQSSLLPSISAALLPWLEHLHGELCELGQWSAPAQALELERTRILVLVENAYRSSGRQLVSECNTIATALRSLMVFAGPRSIAEAFRSAAVSLQATRPQVALTLSALATDLLGQAVSGAEPMDILRRLIAARRDAETQLQLEKPNDLGLIHCLEIGDLPGAVALIIPPAAVPAAAPVPSPAPIARVAMALTAPLDLSSTRPRILVPPLILLNRPSEVTLDSPGVHSMTGVAWTCDPAANADIKMNMSDDKSATITPSQAGFLTVSAKLGIGTFKAQTYAGSMTQTADYIRLVKESIRGTYGIWVLTAVLTSFTGYFIFANTWMGSWGDFFSAFVWGFFGQFSLDRIREAMKTATSRTLP